MSGNKTLENRTGMDLSVVLTVRKGSDPSDTWKTVSAGLGDGDSKTVDYGNDENPYLNGIEVNGVDGGELLSTRAVTSQRGTEVDDGLNTNDTVVVTRDGATFHLEFENTRT